MKFVLVAGDYAQSEVMEMLGNKLQEKGHAIALFLRRGKKEPLPIEDIRKEIQSSDWLVSGMSNVSDDEVAAVRSAHEYGKLVALYADTFANYRFPAFEPNGGKKSEITRNREIERNLYFLHHCRPRILDYSRTRHE